MNRLILVDADDTLLKFDEAFTAWMKAKGYPTLRRADQVRNVEELFGLSEDQAHTLIREFYRTPEFAKIDPLPCAEEVLPRLHAAGYRFVVISACENAPEIAQSRKRNLEEAFGFRFEDIHLSGLFVPDGKRAYLKKYDPAVFVEDNFHHAVTGCELGHQVFLINRLANKGMRNSDIIRVPDWKAIENQLT